MEVDRSIIDNIKITDNILFTSVFENANIVKKFIEVVLNINITEIKLKQKEKVIDSVGKSRGVRFDIYVLDNDNKIYDIEIQTSDEKDLLKRMRYYQGRLDINHLEKGQDFNDLKNTYIIFICTFNYFKYLGLNDVIYRIQPILLTQNNLKYDISDSSNKIIINTKGNLETINNNDLKSFVELLEDGFKPNTKSDLSNMIINEVKTLKENEEWSERYMTLMEEAVKKNTKEIVIKMIQKGLDDDIVLSCSNLTQEQLDEIKKEVF